jgi:ribonuclease III
MQFSEKLTKLQDRLGYQFGDRRIMIQSLTHRSYGHENLQHETIAFRDNERLEFLGDAILDVVISDILLETFPESNEGHLSKMRAAVVNEKTLADMTRSIGLGECLRLGKGELQTGGQDKPSILSSTFEAIIAAIYLDGGFHAVFPVVRHLFRPFFDPNMETEVFQDYKTKLQELVQARFRVTPTYHLISTEGPDHAKTFEIEARQKDIVLGRSSGPSKKQAEQNAAKASLYLFESKKENEGKLS